MAFKAGVWKEPALQVRFVDIWGKIWVNFLTGSREFYPMDTMLIIAVPGFGVSLMLWLYFFHKYRTCDQDQHVEDDFSEILPKGPPEAPEDIFPDELLRGPTPLRPATTLEPRHLSPIVSSDISEALAPEKASLPYKGGVPSIEPEASKVPSDAVESSKPHSDSHPPAGASPAAVYLQALKEQLENIHSDLQGLMTEVAGLSKKHDSQFQELGRQIDQIKSVSAQGSEREASLPYSEPILKMASPLVAAPKPERETKQTVQPKPEREAKAPASTKAEIPPQPVVEPKSESDLESAITLKFQSLLKSKTEAPASVAPPKSKTGSSFEEKKEPSSSSAEPPPPPLGESSKNPLWPS